MSAGLPCELQPAMDLRSRREVIALDGDWEFSYDPDECGLREQWFVRGELPEKVLVPGCAQVREHASARMTPADYAALRAKSGLVDMKWPVLSAAWYRRRFQVPRDWGHQEVWLHLGGIMPGAELWLNGIELGSTRSSRVPIRANLTARVRFGEENVVALRCAWPATGPALDGCFDFITPFSGPYRSVRVESVAPVHIRELYVQTVSVDPPAVVVEILCAGALPPAARIALEIRDVTGRACWATEQVANGLAAGGLQRLALALPEAALWSPAAPALYEAWITLKQGGRVIDAAATRFGLRELRRRGDRILLNGTPIYLRGACDDHDYPATICPPASTDFFRDRLRKARDYGFNHAKSCHEVFTEEYLDAADELGIMVCQEMPFGLVPHRWTDQKAARDLDETEADFLRREFAAIVRSRRNHPCIAIGATIGEVAFNWMSASVHHFLSLEFPALWRALHPGVLIMDLSSTGGEWRSATKRGPRLTDVVEECPGDSSRQEPLSHPLEPSFDLDRPGIYHEYNWIASLPEPDLKPRYAHLPTFPSGVVDLENSAARAGQGDVLPLWVANSRRLKRFLQKEALELARRNHRITGYHFWLIHGFSWCQEGVFNEFWDTPQDIQAAEFRSWNADTVILLDDANRRTFAADREVPLGLQVSHFGLRPLAAPVLRWELTAAGNKVAEGRVPLPAVACGTLSPACPLGLRFPATAIPVQYELTVVLSDNGAEINRNRWPLWAVPPLEAIPWARRIATDLPFVSRAVPGTEIYAHGTIPQTPVVAVDRVTPVLLDWLEQGGRLVLFAGALREYRPGCEYRPGETHPADWANTFSNLYRSPPWNVGREGNMGTVVADHPGLGAFPHGGWCQAPFVPLIHGAYPLVLEWFRPTRIEPIIRSIGHKDTLVDKAYLFEVGVGRGTVLATSLGFEKEAAWQGQPQTAYLLHALLAYAAGEKVQPPVRVAREAFERAVAATQIDCRGRILGTRLEAL